MNNIKGKRFSAKQVPKIITGTIVFAMVAFALLFIVYMLVSINCMFKLKYNKDVRYAYGEVIFIDRELGPKFKGSISIATYVIIDRKKYVITEFQPREFHFTLNSYYRVKFWCHNIRCATVEWSPQPVPSSILQEYFMDKGISKEGLVIPQEVRNRFDDNSVTDGFLSSYGMKRSNQSQGEMFLSLFQLFGFAKKPCTCCSPGSPEAVTEH